MWIKYVINKFFLRGVRFTHFQHRNAFVIGIGGTSNGGKTSLVERISKSFPNSHCIHMDDYFYSQDEIPYDKELGHKNYDIVEAIDFQKLSRDVISWTQIQKETHINTKSSLLFVEGILVLNHKPLSQLFDMRFCMAISKNECIKRRLKRKYPTPDPEGYFDNCLWPQYLKYSREIDKGDIIRLNGELPSETIDQFVKDEIKSILLKKYDDS